MTQQPRVFLSTLPASREQQRLGQKQLAPVPAFMAAYQSALVVGDLITAALLFGQFAILRARSLLFLAWRTCSLR